MWPGFPQIWHLGVSGRVLVPPPRPRPRPRDHEGEATVCRGGFMPYRPLYSYDMDPLANSMYFYGSVAGIMC